MYYLFAKKKIIPDTENLTYAIFGLNKGCSISMSLSPITKACNLEILNLGFMGSIGIYEAISFSISAYESKISPMNNELF